MAGDPRSSRHADLEIDGVDQRIEPRLDPGGLVTARCVEEGVLTVRLLRNISLGGCSIVTEEEPPQEVAVHFEFATTSRLYVTVPARLAYCRPLDALYPWHVSGWQFSPDPDVRQAMAAVIDFLVVNLTID